MRLFSVNNVEHTFTYALSVFSELVFSREKDEDDDAAVTDEGHPRPTGVDGVGARFDSGLSYTQEEER